MPTATVQMFIDSLSDVMKPGQARPGQRLSSIVLWSLNDVNSTAGTANKFPKGFDKRLGDFAPLLRAALPVIVLICGSSEQWMMPGFSECADIVVEKLQGHGVVAL
jgi:hypothetical protein